MNKEQLQAQVQQLHEAGFSIREIAQKTGVSKSSVGRMLKEIQELGAGTATQMRPMAVPAGHGTQGGTAIESLPDTVWDARGTLEEGKNSGHAPTQAVQQDNRAFEEFMRMNYKNGLQSSYNNFLYSTRVFLTNNLVTEELARELIKSRQGRVRDFIMRARGICSNCHVSYEGLYMAYVLEQLHLFLGQQPELEKSKDELKVKAGVVLEQFIKQVERLDVFTPKEHGMRSFPDYL